MGTAELMTAGHPRWHEFIHALSRSVVCRRTTSNARQVLESMTGINVDASLEALRLQGGQCDCEIVYGLAGLEPLHARGRHLPRALPPQDRGANVIKRTRRTEGWS